MSRTRRNGVPSSNRYSYVSPVREPKPKQDPQLQFSVFWINQGYSSPTKFIDAMAALDFVKLIGFDARIDNEDGECVAFWSVIGGVRWYNVDPTRETLPEINPTAPTLKSYHPIKF